jgi:type IV pilus biogenesis/stability protein PilW
LFLIVLIEVNNLSEGVMVKNGKLICILLFFLSSCATTAHDVDRSRAHYQLGLSYIKENKMQLAFVEFQKAVALNSDNKEALNALGVTYLEFGDLQKAEEVFLKAIRVDQNYSEAYSNLGATYGRMGRWPDAISAFRTAAKNPFYRKPEIAYSGLGNAYYRLGQLDDAIDSYREALKRIPDFYRSYYGLALCYNAQGRYGDAASVMKRAIDLDPLFKGDRDKAIEYFNKKRIEAGDKESKDILDYLEILNY